MNQSGLGAIPQLRLDLTGLRRCQSEGGTTTVSHPVRQDALLWHAATQIAMFDYNDCVCNRQLGTAPASAKPPAFLGQTQSTELRDNGGVGSFNTPAG